MRFITLLGLCLPFAALHAQTVDEIKTSNYYYWGEGVDMNTSLADKNALEMLISSISANIESQFTMQSVEGTKNGKSNFTQYVNNLVKTHANATIKNTEILSWGEEPEVHVFRFVRKSEIYKIFAEREIKSKNLWRKR
jgi:hypothetical protein